MPGRFGLEDIIRDTVVPIESAPKNGFAVLIQKLLRYYATIIGFDIHYTNRVIALTANGYRVSPYDIE